MKFILGILTFLAFNLSHAGVGGIEGGHIHFQRKSTWVNSFYNKTICHDGFEFKAQVRLCSKWKVSDDDRKCVEFKKQVIFQPLESTRMRCKIYDDDNCVGWEEVKYFQSPKRLLKFKDEDGNVIKKKKHTVPTCQ